MPCPQIDALTPTPSRTPRGCEECLNAGGRWVHLRLCLTCGHVGCCDSSPGRHATKHAHHAHHPVVASFEPGEGWAWCYVDEEELPVPATVEPYRGTEPRAAHPSSGSSKDSISVQQIKSAVSL